MTIHRGDAPIHVAEDGSFAASTANLPVLQYYPARGRAEPIRLVLAYMNQSWFEPPPASILQIHALLHREFDGFPFRQLPRFIDEVHGEVDIVQSQAILRHLARKYDLYGEKGSLAGAARVDMVLDAVVELRAKIKVVVVDQQLEEGARQAYVDSVLAGEEALKTQSMMGPGLASLEYLLAKRRYSEAGWLVGGGPSVADFAVFDVVDLHFEYFGEVVRSRFPCLVGHHAKVAALQGVSTYLNSDSRHRIIWAVDWVRGHQAGTSA